MRTFLFLFTRQRRPRPLHPSLANFPSLTGVHLIFSSLSYDSEPQHIYWAVQKDLVKGYRQTLDCYCVIYELLSASIAEALWFVNMVCLPLSAERNAHEICLTQECLQIVRCLLWKQTTTHSLRNNNPMFDGNLWPNSFEQPSRLGLIQTHLYGKCVINVIKVIFLTDFKQFSK